MEQCLELGRSVRVSTVEPRLHALQKVMLQVLSDDAATATE